MELINLGTQHSLANHFLTEVRDTSRQADRQRFRANLMRLGEIMAYEISKALKYNQREVVTPLKTTKAIDLTSHPVLVTVLRAGLPYYQGFQNYFDKADSGFVGAYRKEGGKEVEVKFEYLAAPALTGKTVILIDPMLATGRSLIRSIEEMLRHGKPDHIHLATLIAAPEGVKYIQDNSKIPTTLWTFSVDEKLDSRFYIVPGLGDAGDLSFGEKI